MRNRAAVILAVLALGQAATGAVFASGYSIYEQGARAMANAGAFTARADDPSAMFFNPAGIVQLKGQRFNFGTTAIFLTGSSFDSDLSGNSFDQVDNMAWPVNLYYTQSQGDRYAWGVSLTSPFGLKTQWPGDFDGRDISRESNLAVVNFNANFAWSFAKQWSAAVGVDFARADIRELSRNIDLTPLGCAGCQGFSRLTGDGTDVGWNVAMRWANEKGWRWGGSFRSKMKPEIDGEIKFENIPAPFLPLFPDGGATADLPLPATFATGVGYVKGKWEGELDVVWTDWSEFDHLRIDIEKNTALPGPIPVLTDVDQIEEWHDTYSYRLGYTYHSSDRHTYRVGAYLDRNPIPTTHVRPRLPDADRTSVQVGYGFTGKGRFTFDVAYQALFFDSRTVTTLSASASDPVIPGEYKNFTSLLGVNLGWKFGK
jgi:long-chain fatty acid transport protein